jgi:hypothetical protein
LCVLVRFEGRFERGTFSITDTGATDEDDAEERCCLEDEDGVKSIVIALAVVAAVVLLLPPLNITSGLETIAGGLIGLGGGLAFG